MSKVKQNSQYTFKYNISMGRHGWLRLTPAYSVKVVDQILDSLPYRAKFVFEPFSGTGTTELVCANRGIKALAYDVNPFLVWVATVKARIYTIDEICKFREVAEDIVQRINLYVPYEYPPIHNIERWWHKEQLEYLARLKTAIWSIDEGFVKDLLKMAFCREIISLSQMLHLIMFQHHFWTKTMIIHLPIQRQI